MLKFTRIATRKETTFNGFSLPVGAIYGRNRNERFVCANYSGINKGNLILFVQNNNNWDREIVNKNDWRYKEIINVLRELGYIPKIKPHKDPYIPDKPFERNANYNYTPTGSGAGQLIRMKHDNADHSGGGSVIHNPDSYREIFVDMVRRCCKNPLYE